MVGVVEWCRWSRGARFVDGGGLRWVGGRELVGGDGWSGGVLEWCRWSRGAGVLRVGD